MLSILYYPLLATGFYLVYLTYSYIRNAAIARRTNFPSIHLPFLVQNHPLWMVISPMSRLWLKRKLPTWLFNRVALSIYGLEFYQRDQPFVDYVQPQIKSNPKLLGNGKSYVLVTSDRLEFWTWDQEIAKEITARPKDFTQFDIGSIVMGVFGDNVLTTDGDEWSRHRRIVAGAVTERVSGLVWAESIRQTSDLLNSIYTKRSDTEDGDLGTTNHMFDLIKRITIHVLYAAGMGNKQEFETTDASIAGETLEPGMRMTYIDAVKIVNENTAGPTFFPTWILTGWPSFLPGAKWLHEIGRAKIAFPLHTRAALAKEKQMAVETGQSRNNVMGALIAASEQNEGDPEKGTTRKGPALSDEELVANLYIFTAAGFETTANALSYALVLLARNPRWQDWLVEELDQLLPADPTAELEYTAIFPKAHRALSILLETMRLFPPVIHIGKMTQAPQTVTTPSSGTFTIPAKTTLYVNSIALHTDPSVWRNLNMTHLERQSASDDEDGIRGDEHTFRPARWINPAGSPSVLYQPAKGTYLPWSAGPRVCPGQKMAQVEFVGILTTLFRRHRLEVVRKHVPVKGAPEVKPLESDDALQKRLDALMENSIPKLTLEMDVYNIQDGEDRGLSVKWVKRK